MESFCWFVVALPSRKHPEHLGLFSFLLSFLVLFVVALAQEETPTTSWVFCGFLVVLAGFLGLLLGLLGGCCSLTLKKHPMVCCRLPIGFFVVFALGLLKVSCSLTRLVTYFLATLLCCFCWPRTFRLGFIVVIGLFGLLGTSFPNPSGTSFGPPIEK